MEVLQLSMPQLAVLGLAIIGAVEFLDRLRAKDLWVASKILAAALIGGLVAVYYGVDFLSGITTGLGASGLLKGVNSIGNKTPATESTLFKKGQ